MTTDRHLEELAATCERLRAENAATVARLDEIAAGLATIRDEAARQLANQRETFESEIERLREAHRKDFDELVVKYRTAYNEVTRLQTSLAAAEYVSERRREAHEAEIRELRFENAEHVRYIEKMREGLFERDECSRRVAELAATIKRMEAFADEIGNGTYYDQTIAVRIYDILRAALSTQDGEPT